jgi:hypothetical protein
MARGLLRRRGHDESLRVVAITVALSGCGGSLASPVDGGPADAGASPTGCPSTHDIDTKAAVGKACTPDGTTCLNPACDACNEDCPAVRCAHGIWTPAVNTAICIAPDAGTGSDTGAPPDAGLCIDMSPSGFDQACTGDPDCIRVAVGTMCTNAPWCMCAAASINVADQARYEAALEDMQSRITPGPQGCSCPFFGSPRCVGSRCTLCGGAGSSPGCPDGG